MKVIRELIILIKTDQMRKSTTTVVRLKFWPKTIAVVNQSLDFGIPRPEVWSVNTGLVSQDRYQSFYKPVLIHRIHGGADGIHGWSNVRVHPKRSICRLFFITGQF